MRILNQKSIESIINPVEVMDAIEEAYRLFKRGKYVMPSRFGFENDGKTLLYMPCFIEDTFGTKMLTLVPKNRERNLPSIDGMIVLNDHETGQPIALLDGKSVTAWRTGGVGGVAIRHLARREAHRLGIIGTGVQGFHQAVCVSAAHTIDTIAVYDAYKDTSHFVQMLKEKLPSHMSFIQCSNAEQLLENSDIVVTTTFSQERPYCQMNLSC